MRVEQELCTAHFNSIFLQLFQGRLWNFTTVHFLEMPLGRLVLLVDLLTQLVGQCLHIGLSRGQGIGASRRVSLDVLGSFFFGFLFFQQLSFSLSTLLDSEGLPIRQGSIQPADPGRYRVEADAGFHAQRAPVEAIRGSQLLDQLAGQIFCIVTRDLNHPLDSLRRLAGDQSQVFTIQNGLSSVSDILVDFVVAVASLFYLELILFFQILVQISLLATNLATLVFCQVGFLHDPNVIFFFGSSWHYYCCGC
mmetsp:Transcript_50436/g.76762  ORF Transcript_50436/g.76762 Transcript_50436/m.76762 type:complete len:251 (-) Transcript_50436:68-820(-)